MSSATYSGYAYNKRGHCLFETTGHPDHRSAALAVAAGRPGDNEIQTGRGYHGTFDMRWWNPRDLTEKGHQHEHVPSLPCLLRRGHHRRAGRRTSH